LGDFRAAKGLKVKLTVVLELLKNVQDLGDKEAAAKEVIAALNPEITSHQRTQPSLALEAIFARDELRKAAGVPPTEGELPSTSIWGQNLKLGPLLEQMPASKHSHALLSFVEANPDRWHQTVLGI